MYTVNIIFLSDNSKPVVTRGRKATGPAKDGRDAEKRAPLFEQTPFTDNTMKGVFYSAGLAN
jgi:hypothetical protein